MKPAGIALLLVPSAFFRPAPTTPNGGAARRVSPDYTATSTATDARAYLYGNRTLLAFDAAPAFLAVRDETGASVDYERVGRYYRLSRALNNFTVWVNGRSVTFSAATTTRVFSAPAAAPEPRKPAPLRHTQIRDSRSEQ